MKKHSLLLPICLVVALFMACTNDPKSSDTTAAADSVNIKDTTSTANFSEEDEIKVIGNINFGISKKEFDKEEQAFMATLDHNEHQTTYAIGGYLFSDLSGKFDLDKLNELNMTGDFIHQDRYEAELLPQVEILKDLVAKKYGEPHQGSGAPAYQNLKKDQSNTAYSWTIGSKIININVVNRKEYSSCDLKIVKK
ncbi:hypothetical protein IWX76_002439 [Pedobacter sp. CAN_A7]|uniref:hypothetical protein n=1 Tax=Pedobacter sp. CAN_A7 TaxID=2787722 RepID=UPI0018C973EA